ncbi:MAG: SpvB/TcaC N-terminal domain-containing protein [Candidatus Paceibacterota bacterium]
MKLRPAKKQRKAIYKRAALSVLLFSLVLSPLVTKAEIPPTPPILSQVNVPNNANNQNVDNFNQSLQNESLLKNSLPGVTESAPVNNNSSSETKAVSAKDSDRSNAKTLMGQSSALTSSPISTNIKTGISQGKITDPTASSDPGALDYEYDFKVPPGRNGVAPDVRLSYSSKNGQDLGFGYGWAISIPYIVRYNKTGFDTLYSTTSPSTYFYSLLSGELASTSATNYVARNDDGSNTQYTFSSNTWKAIDKNGNTYFFGPSSSSQQDDPGGSGRTYKWMLQKITDTNGNSITYSYTKDLGQIYPSTITYTDTASTTGIFNIGFTLGLQASSTATSSIAGFPVKTRYQINQVVVQTNATTTHNFSLTYGSGDNGSRTVLKNIIETGQNSLGTLSLPATSFAYSTSTAAMATSTIAGAAGGTVISSGGDQAVYVGDINGDGITDMVRSWESRNSGGGVTGSTSYMAYLNTASSTWMNSPSYYAPKCILDWYTDYATTLNYVQDAGGRIIDANGDGFADYICGTNVYLNNGSNGWATTTSFTTPLAMTVTDSLGNSIDAGIRFADINGDGLLDMVRGYSGTGGYIDSVYLNNGNGWTNSSAWQLPTNFKFTVDGGGDGGGRIVDVNGDGLADLYVGLDSSGTATSSVYINNGKGWSYDSSWILPSGVQPQLPGVMFSDVNGDHLVDVSVATSTLSNPSDINTFAWTDNRVYLNTGSGWKLDPIRKVPLAYAIYNSVTGPDTSPRTGNFSGYGLNDILVDSYVGSVHYVGVQISQGDSPDLLKKIIEPAGKQISINYKSSSDLYSGDNNQKLPYYFPVVKKIDYYDGVATTTSESYTYRYGSMYFGSPIDRRFAGFEQIQKADGLGNISISYYQTANGTDTARGEYNDNQSKIGLLYRTENFDSSFNTYKIIVTKFDNFVRAAANFVWPVRRTELDYDGLLTNKGLSEEFSYSTTTGDLLQKISWGQVIAGNDGSFTDVGTDKFINTISYAASSTIPVSKIAQTTTVDQSGNTIAGTKFFYDSLGLGSLAKGNLTEKDDLKTAPSTYVQTIRNVYNSYGLITQAMDSRSATTTFNYDPYNIYIATTTNALGHITTTSYNYSLGAPTQLKDANGAITKVVFDPLDRILALLRPDPLSTTTLATSTAYTYTDTSYPRSVHEMDYLDSANIVHKYTYKDGYDRIIEQRTQAEGTNTYKVKDTIYNALGLVYKTSLPFFASSTAYTGTTSPAVASLLTTYLYDPLQRVIQASTYINYILHSYGNWKDTATDTNGKKKDFYNDAYGNLTNVVEYIATTTSTSTYAYDGTGNLTKITDGLGNVRNFTYDLLGRVLKNEDLHAAADTSFGSTTYAYDDNGNITQSISPRGKITNFTYDLLNRVKTEDSPDTAYTDVFYTYDNSLHAGIGRLGNVSTAYIGTGYDYDWNGNLLAEQHLIPGSATTTTWYYYDRLGNPTYIVYPDNSDVYYGYNSAGLVNNVQQYEPSIGAWKYLVSNYDYSPMDQVTLTQYGNNTVSLNTYIPTNLYWLGSRIAYNAVKYFQYQVYGHDSEGNITSAQEAASVNSAKIVYYTYDDLYRLITASSTGAVNGQNFKQIFAYDKLGNLLTNSGVNYQYQGNTGTNYANPDAPTTIGSATNTYDQSGNLLTNGSLTNLWDYRDHLIQTSGTVGSTTATSTFTYDQVGNRLTKTVGGLSTYYANKYYTITSGGTQDKYVFANGQLLTTIETVGTTTKYHYSVSDPISSSNVTTDNLGNIEQLLDYYPYGTIRLNEASTTYDSARKYIGEYYDPAPALSYLNARYYDGGRGQFISEDPIFLGNPRDQDLTNPQNLNSYSYAIDNPVTYNDPSGKQVQLLIPILPIVIEDTIIAAEAGYSAYSTFDTAMNIKNTIQADTAKGRDVSFGKVVYDVATEVIGHIVSKQERRMLSLITASLDVGNYVSQQYLDSVSNKNSSGSSVGSSGGSSGGVSVSGTSKSSSNAANSSKNNSTNNQQSSSNTNPSRSTTTTTVTTTVKTTVTVIGNTIITTKTTTTTVTVRRN